MTLTFDKPRLTAEAIAKADVSDYDILAHFVSGFKGFPSKMKSNIRHGDKDASLHFIYRNGRAVISDFGSHNQGMNVYSYLVQLLSLPDTKQGYLSALEAVRRAFNHNRIPYTTPHEKVALRASGTAKRHNVVCEESSPWDIRFRSRDWTWSVDKKFWYDRYGITRTTLDLFNVKPLESFILQRDSDKITYLASEDNPSYAYVPHSSLGITGWKRKIYSPLTQDTKRKWFNSLPKSTSLGLHTLPKFGDTLLLETSMKDSMTAYELFRTEDVWSTDLFSESVFLTPALFKHLKERFRTIIYHGDRDETGIRMAKIYSQEYGIPYIINPEWGGKDTSDMVHNVGQKETYQFLKSCLKTIKNQTGPL